MPVLHPRAESETAPRKIIDVSYEDYEGQMNKSGIHNGDCLEPFMFRRMQMVANNSLNVARVKEELQKEQSRRKI